MRRLSSVAGSIVLLLAAAGSAAAVQPTIDQPSFPTTFYTNCGDVQLLVNVTFNKVTEYWFYDQAGNLVSYHERGPYQFTITAPNGSSLTRFSNAMFFIDFQSGKVVDAGVQLFAGGGGGTYTSSGLFDFNTGTLHGVFTDLCPLLGYPAS